ncbi:MAG: hypothetical protein QME68_02510, partial [Elusimicrobiota bacterium]|nr:hypothetical protein [Elusimicrobiota bacterium]
MAEHIFQSAKDKKSLSNYNPEVKLVFVDLGEDKYENVSISSIVQKLGFGYEIRISNHSASVQKRTINVAVDSKNIFDSSVRVGAKKAETIEIELEPCLYAQTLHQPKDTEEASSITGNAKLQPDALNPDDIYYFV